MKLSYNKKNLFFFINLLDNFIKPQHSLKLYRNRIFIIDQLLFNITYRHIFLSIHMIQNFVEKKNRILFKFEIFHMNISIGSEFHFCLLISLSVQ